MRSIFYATKPDEISMTMQITMPLKDWREIRAAIQKSIGAYHPLHREIDSMVFSAEKNFQPAIEPAASEVD